MGFSRMVWVLPPSQTFHYLDLPRLLSLLVLLRLVPCLQANTLEDPRIFQLALMDPVEPSQEDTHSQPKLRTLMSVTGNSILRSKTPWCYAWSFRCHVPLTI